MVKKKGKSKRTTLKDKYKIQKRTVQTHRKLRKQAKKDAANGVVQKKKKDPGIPNSWPFKAELLQEVRREKERQQDLQNHRKEERAERLRELREHQRTGGTARTVEELAAAAARRRAEYESQQEAVRGAAAESEEAGSSANADDGRRRLGQSSRRAYLRQLKQLVDRSDVLLQVLDARDPVGTRLGRAMEDAILSHSDKRMVLVLNKIDLVPREVVGAWLSHLRRSHPTIALQANKVVPSGKGSGGTNRRNDRSMDGSDSAGGDEAMSVATGASTGTASSSLTPGMDGLLQLLKNYARTSGGGKNSKTTIVVGVGTFSSIPCLLLALVFSRFRSLTSSLLVLQQSATRTLASPRSCGRSRTVAGAGRPSG
jgi:nuclear GTP-binding protein